MKRPTRRRILATAPAALTLGGPLLAPWPARAAKNYGPGVTDSEIKIGNTGPYSGPPPRRAGGRLRKRVEAGTSLSPSGEPGVSGTDGLSRHTVTLRYARYGGTVGSYQAGGCCQAVARPKTIWSAGDLTLLIIDRFSDQPRPADPSPQAPAQ